MSILTKLTEGIRSRDLQKEGDALLNKWEQTGLLEGMTTDVQKNGMARLLENQASQLLKESSSMSAGDVEGFASVAFPLVRRVFGGLLANDIVSVQPMSLPSGLIFFLDFTFNTARIGQVAADLSVYGGGVVGKGIQDGVTLDGTTIEGSGGFYNLATGYSSPTGSIGLADATASTITDMTAGEVGDKDITEGILAVPVAIGSLSNAEKKAIRFDADLLAHTSTLKMASIVVKLTDAQAATIAGDSTTAMFLVDEDGSQLNDGVGEIDVIRRLTHLGHRDASGNIVAGTVASNYIQFYTLGSATADNAIANCRLVHIAADNFSGTAPIGGVLPQNNWGLEEANNAVSTFKDVIPEIDIKVDSIAVTAQTKKLKAKWSPELGQDLSAYHNLDAEVELTSILSEQIALEIDREILQDLVAGATAGTFYWSRSPGLFVNRTTGAEIGATSAAPDFTGTVSEWYETLVETINDVSAQIHRKTLRGGANFIVVSPEVANVLEFTAGFRASVTADADSGTVGAVKVGAMSKKFDVYVDPYFHRNVVLVGRKGGSFLESGYVYAPYVPLQVTPTIFGTEDFVPRKGVMTRYAKKMVRPDMYGLVIVRGLLGESGA
jgi:hypothetical protein